MNMKKIIMFAAIAAMLVSCGGKPNMKFGDNEYAVRTIGTQSTELQNNYPATIRGIQDVEIRPKISGFITKLCVQEGQSVNAGQLLFVIDNVQYAEAAKQAKAAVAAAQAQLATAQLTYTNKVQLHKQNVIGSYDLQAAQNSLLSAKANLAQAQATYISAKQNLDFCYVKSPSTGVIGDLPFRVGALVNSSNAQALTTVSNINKMYVYFSMTEKQLLEMTRQAGSAHKAVSEMPAVKLQLADGTIYNHDGKVTTVSGVIDKTTGTVSMRADFINPEHLLKSGGSGSIIVPYTNSSAIIIPQDAVSDVQDKHFVYVVGSDNKVKYTEVQIAPNNDGKNYIITSGIKTGDRIVIAGISSLQDGMDIKPVTEAQYAAKLKKAEQLGSVQNDAKKLKQAFGK
ncbi:MAG: efflux RND transporter periplasmic adaptor subunit [Bacteroidaceae bacterium]|jgi:membrane fusion protein (multidrug efflux system)|nr:efflux RND transporter periplasmic adaptor subunit [Bacteroidaceae bacterium]